MMNEQAPLKKIGLEKNGIQHKILHGPSFAMLRAQLKPGESLVAEAGAMVSRDKQVLMETRLNANRGSTLVEKLLSFIVALIRKLVARETFFVNDFTAPETGEVCLAPHLSGDIMHRRLEGGSVVLSAGSFLAMSGGLNMKQRWGGLRGLLSRSGILFLEVSGHGDLFFTSFGGIETAPVGGTFVVDTGHIVGFDSTLDFNIKFPGGGLMGLIASGEGLICEFTGQGNVYLQTRSVPGLLGWIGRYLPP